MITHEFAVNLTQKTVTTWAKDSDTAVDMVLEAEGAPFEAFVSVYQTNPTPDVSAPYGAPMARMSNGLDHDGNWRADRVDLDEGGYDPGGAYWGLHFGPAHLFAVQDGMGNIAFVDALGPDTAKAIAAQ
jgi:hypothetical protein